MFRNNAAGEVQNRWIVVYSKVCETRRAGGREGSIGAVGKYNSIEHAPSKCGEVL